MIHWFKKGNIKYLLGIVLFIELILFVLPTLNYTGFVDSLNLSAVLPGVLNALTNDERAKSAAPQLSENALLDQAATLKAEDMAAKSYFAHTSPEGKTPWYWFNLVGYKYTYAGENLAVNFVDSADVTAAWMNSPTHRANIVNMNYKEVGTGVATGTYKGYPAVFVAQLFGAPRGTNASSNTNGASAASAWGMLLLSPHQSVNVVLLALFALTALALLLHMFLPSDRKHGDLVANGLFIALVLLCLYAANNYLAARRSETSFIAFDLNNKVIE